MFFCSKCIFYTFENITLTGYFISYTLLILSCISLPFTLRYSELIGMFIELGRDDVSLETSIIRRLVHWLYDGHG